MCLLHRKLPHELRKHLFGEYRLLPFEKQIYSSIVGPLSLLNTPYHSMQFDPQAFSTKRRSFRETNHTYKITNDTSKPKFYVLDMFPYPSGAGLHVGHPLGYIASDIYSRYMRMKGFNVLHPMGFDAFGLPAEQYAIQTGTHPASATAKNIETYKKQLENLGLSYDWSREVNTSEAGYYKWTQWIFLKLFTHYYDPSIQKARPITELVAQFEKQGNVWVHATSSQKEQFTADQRATFSPKQKDDVLMNYRLAYRNTWYVNRCEALWTVLANDEVKNGLSERGWHPVERREMKQRALRITAYVDRLLNDLDTLERSDALKAMQKNWIGKSEGAEIDFAVGWGKWQIQTVLVLHGKKRPETNDNNWWVSHVWNICKEKWYNTIIPFVDNSRTANWEEWEKALEANKHDIHSNTVLVWHSAWGAAVVRWLWNNPDITIAKLILVAPGKIPEENKTVSTQTWKPVDPAEYEWIKDLYNFAIDESIKERVKNGIFVMTSNDSERLLASADMYIQALDATHITLENRWHFNSSFGDGKINATFPELVNMILTGSHKNTKNDMNNMSFTIDDHTSKLMEILQQLQAKWVQENLQPIILSGGIGLAINNGSFYRNHEDLDICIVQEDCERRKNILQSEWYILDTPSHNNPLYRFCAKKWDIKIDIIWIGIDDNWIYDLENYKKDYRWFDKEFIIKNYIQWVEYTALHSDVIIQLKFRNESKDILDKIKFHKLDLPNITVFTTRPDTVYGVTALVLAPENTVIDSLIPAEQQSAVDAYRKATSQKSEVERQQETETKSWVFSGVYATHPLTNERVPIWFADYVLPDYGTWAVMFVPAHDERDWEFAKTHWLPVKQVILPHEVPKDEIEKLLSVHQKIQKIANEHTLTLCMSWWLSIAFYLWIVYRNHADLDYAVIAWDQEDFYTTLEQEWFTKQFVKPNWVAVFDYEWIEIEIGNSDSIIPWYVKLDKNCAYETHTLRGTMALTLPSKFLWETKKAMFQAKWREKDKQDYEAIESWAYTWAWILINSWPFDWLQNEAAKSAIIEHLEKAWIWRKKISFKLRDASFSRQRYWGEPIPVEYDADGVAYPIDESELPLVLPVLEKFQWVGGKSPLSNALERVSHNGRTRETDTMPGYAWSSWYYLRYMDPRNNDAFASKDAINYWENVDLYIGWTEHAVGHLMYSRFWHKFLYDIGHVTTIEPFKKLFNQWMIEWVIEYLYFRKAKQDGKTVFVCASLVKKENKDQFSELPIHINYVKDYGLQNSYIDQDSIKGLWERRPDFANALFEHPDWIYDPSKDATSQHKFRILTRSENGKMSKSYYNVINPDSVIWEYGADCFRMYEMFLWPVNQSKPWNMNGIDGVYKFLKKVWALCCDEHGLLKLEDVTPSPAELKIIHTCIKKVHNDIATMSLNTCVSNFMITVNSLKEVWCKNRIVIEMLLRVLAPFAPFMTEELRSALWHSTSIHLADYPTYDEKYLVEDEVTYPFCINGKRKTEIVLPASMNEEDIKTHIITLDIAQKLIDGKPIKQVIVVPGRMINVVM